MRRRRACATRALVARRTRSVISSAGPNLRVFPGVVALAALLGGISRSQSAETPPASPRFDRTAIEAVLDDAWKSLEVQQESASIADVDVVQTVALDEWAQAMADCLKEQGHVRYGCS